MQATDTRPVRAICLLHHNNQFTWCLTSPPLLLWFCVQRENLGPHQLALDRPSPKLLPFMERHFALTTYTPQSNHFVLFHEYFKDSSNTAATRTKTASQNTLHEIPTHIGHLTLETQNQPSIVLISSFCALVTMKETFLRSTNTSACQS